MSLFEVVISLAILMGALAAIGQLISTGARGAVDAKLHSQAVIRCETTMAEIQSGYMGLRSTTGTFTDDPNWTWSVAVSSTQHSGLYLVEVKSEHKGTSSMGQVSFALRRFIRDPAAEVAAYAAALAAEEEKAAAAANSSSTGSGQ
ncbi:MAG: hypothetical protein JSS02_01515 [Planctomycetes bacterium]|nr:hypothetical protein [Planctomycetota bacterium]